MPALHAQARPFAPAGAEWYFESPYGVFHSYVARDTVVQGKTAAILKQDAIRTPFWAQQGYPLYNLTTELCYSNADTVFLFNRFFNRFTPLYVFNVQAGDTIGLPMMPLTGTSINNWGTDSTFYFVVDSVKMVLYDTARLKTVYPRGITKNGSAILGWPGGYIEKLGTSGGFRPICLQGCSLVPENDQPTGIRCYHDGTVGIKLVSDACNKDLSSGIGTAREEVKVLGFFPNPAGNQLTIQNHTGKQILGIKIYSLDGRLAQPEFQENGQMVSLRTVANGTYLIQFTLQDGQTARQRLVVAH